MQVVQQSCRFTSSSSSREVKEIPLCQGLTGLGWANPAAVKCQDEVCFEPQYLRSKSCRVSFVTGYLKLCLREVDACMVSERTTSWYSITRQYLTHRQGMGHDTISCLR